MYFKEIKFHQILPTYGHCKVLTWWYAVQQRLLVLRRSSSGTPDIANVTATVSAHRRHGWIFFCFQCSGKEDKTSLIPAVYLNL